MLFLFKSWKNKCTFQKNIFIDGLVNGGRLVFTILRTYTSSKLLPVWVFDCRWPCERQRQSNTLTIRVMCCSLVFVLLYSEFIKLAKIYCYKTVSIRVSRIEPDPFIIVILTLSTSFWQALPSLSKRQKYETVHSRCNLPYVILQKILEKISFVA